MAIGVVIIVLIAILAAVCAFGALIVLGGYVIYAVVKRKTPDARNGLTIWHKNQKKLVEYIHGDIDKGIIPVIVKHVTFDERGNRVVSATDIAIKNMNNKDETVYAYLLTAFTAEELRTPSLAAAKKELMGVLRDAGRSGDDDSSVVAKWNATSVFKNGYGRNPPHDADILECDIPIRVFLKRKGLISSNNKTSEVDVSSLYGNKTYIGRMLYTKPIAFDDTMAVYEARDETDFDCVVTRVYTDNIFPWQRLAYFGETMARVTTLLGYYIDTRCKLRHPSRPAKDLPKTCVSLAHRPTNPIEMSTISGKYKLSMVAQVIWALHLASIYGFTMSNKTTLSKLISWVDTKKRTTSIRGKDIPTYGRLYKINSNDHEILSSDAQDIFDIRRILDPDIPSDIDGILQSIIPGDV